MFGGMQDVLGYYSRKSGSNTDKQGMSLAGMLINEPPEEQLLV